jgi:hypothetical protein
MSEVLTGRWVIKDGQAIGDSVCDAIDRLVSDHLEQVAKDKSGWYTLFRDRRDGQLWERSYPSSHLHGGGPPQLAKVSAGEAAKRFGKVPA